MRRRLSLLAWLVVASMGSGQAATLPRRHSVAPHAVATPAPVVPPAPPPPAVIPPPDTAPPHPTASPPPPVVHGGAPGEARPLGTGLRLTFGAGRADFNPATEAALLHLATAGRAAPETVYTLYAHAPGVPQDTSTPRRLSLERGLAVRSALINAGIASTRIYVHAMGATGAEDGAPADRVDIALATLDTKPPAAAPSLPGPR